MLETQSDLIRDIIFIYKLYNYEMKKKGESILPYCQVMNFSFFRLPNLPLKFLACLTK